MRHRQRTLLLAACLWAGCTLPLDNGTSSDAVGETDTVTGCALFSASAATHGVGHSVDLANGATLWTFDGQWPSGGRSDGIVGTVTPTAGGCPGTLAISDAALPAIGTDSDFATPLDLVRVGSDVWQFYETWRFAADAPFGVKVVGRGVGRWDDKLGHFVRGPQLLWTADRPNYGAAALRDGVWVYAYGCVSTDSGWSRACYVARVPALQVADGGAWQYATGIDQFTANPDDAQPVLMGVGDISVRRHASGRLLISYIKPLDTLLQLRAALAPTGPFSAAHPLGRCDAPADVFCVGAVQHPELDPDAVTVAVTFSRASFAPLADELRRPRLALLPLPVDLP